MTDVQSFELSGIARPVNVTAMLDEICEHFVEHAEVTRQQDKAVLASSHARIELLPKPDHLEIRLACGSDEELNRPARCLPSISIILPAKNLSHSIGRSLPRRSSRPIFRKLSWSPPRR